MALEWIERNVEGSGGREARRGREVDDWNEEDVCRAEYSTIDTNRLQLKHCL